MQNNDNQKTYFIYIRSTGDYIPDRILLEQLFTRLRELDPEADTNIKADKEKSTEKIDGAVATIMALDRAIRYGNDTGASVYDSRGLLLI